MKTLISLDYELFFGRNIGTVDNCLIRPIERLLQVTQPFSIKLSLFVDVGFLVRLRQEANRYQKLSKEYSKVATQLSALVKGGHDVQLHIHSHWEDCRFDGEQWQMDVSRYRLHDFSSNEISQIVGEYKSHLAEITDSEVFAFRAGGWCLQPFEELKNALMEHGIWLDSTVYRDGLSEDADRFYDFRNMPNLPWWRFSDDPLKVNEEGNFVEIPISAIRMHPLFYWKLLATKKLLKGQFKSYGDGEYIIASKTYYLDRLFKTTMSPVTLDGVKAGLLDSAYYQQHPESIFNVMGHPKTLCDYSLKKLGGFLQRHGNQLEPVSYQDFAFLRNH